MSRSIGDILGYFEDTLGDLLIVASALLFFISLLFMSTFYQWISASTLFFGVILLVSGATIRLEGPLTLTIPSRSGFGTILVCVSLVTIASTGVCIIFTTPGEMHTFTEVHFGEVKTFIWIEVVRPLAWLAMPLVTIGLCLLIVGVLLKRL